MKEEWKQNQYYLIEEKTNHLIQKIKEGDKCNTEEKGKLYAASMSALTTLEQKGKIERNIGPSRYMFARSPSINNIARSMRTKPSKFSRSITAENITGLLGIQRTARNFLQQSKRRRRNTYSKLKTQTAKKKRSSFFRSLDEGASKLKKLFLK
jgi:hypothetical protein